MIPPPKPVSDPRSLIASFSLARGNSRHLDSITIGEQEQQEIRGPNQEIMGANQEIRGRIRR